MSGVNQHAEASEIFIKGETWHAVKQVRDNHIRNGVTKREPFISGEVLRDLMIAGSFFLASVIAGPRYSAMVRS